MAEQPEHDEVGVDFAIHHAFEVELDVGLARQADVITQQAQSQTVGYKTPEMVVATIQQFLYQAMRAGAGCACDPGGAAVEVEAVADQMHGTVVPEVGNGIALAVDLSGPGCRQTAIAEFLQ